ncbi:hypothetical protein WOLCODRAFT_127314 [Wolfiporia cocos MD-104 SS10]|uniref:Protein kinase domain-containing protein n=1 Tax=Wolfiporia cocos (strain MD-104) TaxID=742152 RepID=A0A2H3J3J9_WOLCO|nr:hypothetical protein WOLCODRAFT_127314 [Wolfiporia cocos MD-104 SS10]
MDEDEERDVLTEMIKQFNRSKKEDRDSPSQSAKPTNYLKHQNGSAPILDGRYGDHPTSLAPPIEIYHPAFAAFVGNYHNESLTPPEDLVAATSKFMDDMSQISSLEHSRKSTREHLARLLDIVVDQNANKNKTIADHYVTYDRKTQPSVKAALAIIEEKAELGQSSEPSVQGEFSYLHYWTQDDRQGLFDACFCPSFIISVAGPWFSVCGGIHTTHPIVHRLSSFEWLGQSRIIDDDRVHRLARIFFALRLAIGKLKEWYKTLVVPDVRHGPSPARFYPLANKCKLPDDEVLQFCYEKPLKGSKPECVTFLASDCNDRARRFVIKFVERYGVDAHLLLAMHGYAPKLLYYGPVWPDELEQRGVGPRKMVVMEFIEGKTTVKRYPDGYIPQGVVDAVEAALDLLHDGERKMVYGDLREPNIMVEDGAVKGKEKEGTKIVDFDWAGIEGEVRYPFHLSGPVKRGIKGVDDYKLIQASHDRARLEKLKGRVKQVV